jgi:hypothetical protein
VHAVTTPDAPATRTVWIRGALVFALGLVACWIHLGPDLPVWYDNRYYFFVAERAASGTAPHLSLFDPKNHLSSLIGAAAIWLGRCFELSDLFAMRTVSVLFAATTGLLVWLLALRLSTRLIVADLAALAFLSLPQYYEMAAMGARPKVFLAPFVLGCVLAVGRGRPLVAGACGALAFLVWQPAALVVLCALAVLAFLRTPLARLGRFVAAAVAVVAAYHLYFLAHGALDELIEQAYVFPARYFQHDAVSLIANARETFRVHEGWTWTCVVPLLSVAALAALWLSVLRRPRAWLARLRVEPCTLAFLAVAHAALAFTIYDLQGYPDRFFLEPFMAVAVALLFARALRVRAAAAPVLGLALALAASTHALSEPTTGLAAQQRKASALRRIADAGRSVYVVRATHLLAMNRMDNFHPISNFHRGVVDYIRAKTGSPDFRPESDGRLPDVIVIDGETPACLEKLLREYEQVRTIGGPDTYQRRPGRRPRPH